MTTRPVKILYVCPFAHDFASYSFMAFHEGNALSQAGAEVELLTFKGLLDKAPMKIKQWTVRRHITLSLPLYYLANLMRKSRYTRMFAKLIEYSLTLMVAIRLKKKNNYDVLHLREGDPFLFILHLLNLPQRGNNWAVILIGAEFIAQSSLQPSPWKNPKQFFGMVFIRAMNSNFWKPVFSRSSARNKFVYLTENEAIKNSYQPYMKGVLARNIFCLPLGVNRIDKTISKEEARKYLGIPTEKPVFLCFGSPHAGKEWEAIYIALKDIKDVFLLHGGNQRLDDRGLSLQLPNSLSLSEKYGVSDRVLIKDHYISEEEKPYYFFASDAIILSYTRQFLSNASSLWEACRFETPVIMSDNSQLKEIMDSYRPGLVFKAQDPDSLRETMMRFMDLSQEELLNFKENCRRFNEEFSINRWAKQCLLIYADHLF